MPDETAACLYAGLVTDTGRFQYEATTPDTLRIAAALREHPFDHARLVQALYEDNAAAFLRVSAVALSSGHVRARGRPGLDVPDAGGPVRGRRRSRRDRRPDRPDPHRARRGRRGGAQAAAGRAVQGQHALARRRTTWRRSPPPSAAADTGWRPATPRSTVRRERSRGWSRALRGEPADPCRERDPEGCSSSTSRGA